MPEHTYESLVQAFRYFGGVPKSVLVDNQKAAVLRHDREGRVTFNQGFLALANHYGFTARRAGLNGRVPRARPSAW